MSAAGKRWLAPGVAATVACLAALASGQPLAYRVEPSLTHAEFVVVNFGMFPMRGRFEKVSGRLTYDPAGATGSINFDIAAASVTTGWSVHDSLIRGENLFDARLHPVIRFRSTRLEFSAGRLARIDGELTLRGVTRLVSFAVAHMACGRDVHPFRDGCDAEASGTIRRSDFGMDFGWPMIGDEVELRFHVVALRD